MTATMQARTARKPYRCEGCRRTTIRSGHRYLNHTAFPDGDINNSSRPHQIKECVYCWSERTDDDSLMIGACGTFCCGDVPCARPHPHDGDHSCRRCPAEVTR